MKKALAMLTLAAVVAGCGSLAQKAAPAGSGRPEGLFFEASLRDVSNKLIGGCARAAGTMTRAEAHRVECRLPMGLRDAALVQVVTGKASPVMPKYILGFTMVEEGPDVRVFADAVSDAVLPLGQPQRANMMTHSVANQAMQILLAAGAVAPQDEARARAAAAALAPAPAAPALPAVVATQGVAPSGSHSGISSGPFGVAP